MKKKELKAKANYLFGVSRVVMDTLVLFAKCKGSASTLIWYLGYIRLLKEKEKFFSQRMAFTDTLDEGRLIVRFNALKLQRFHLERMLAMESVNSESRRQQIMVLSPDDTSIYLEGRILREIEKSKRWKKEID